jgi:integrase
MDGKRDRIASPEEAAALIAALLEGDRALWVTAFYAGLRLGELRGLRREDVDLASGVIRVERSWDPCEGPVEPKSRAGRRAVPVPTVLRDHLVEHRMSQGRAAGLVFGRSGDRPFAASSVHQRAQRAWKAAELNSITLHEARHTFASLMIAAGVNAKALSTYMRHANIAITYDRYGHLMPGNEAEAAALLDLYLESQRASVAAAV